MDREEMKVQIFCAYMAKEWNVEGVSLKMDTLSNIILSETERVVERLAPVDREREVLASTAGMLSDMLADPSMPPHVRHDVIAKIREIEEVLER